MQRASCLFLFFVLFAQAAWGFRTQLAPLHVAADPSQRVEGEYLVLLREGLSRPLFETQVASLRAALYAAADGSELKHVFAIGPDFRALHLKLSPRLLDMVRRHPDVALVEENQVVRTSETCRQQKDVPWNLGRIDTHELARVDDDYSYGFTGRGVDVFIIDTGILTSHVEFGGRAEWGANFGDQSDFDCNGHGTHVAGIVAGHRYGVAKNATVIAVKVLGCAGAGSWGAVISGVQWTAEQAKKRGRPAVANMSLSGGKSPTANAAVAAAVALGVTISVAAGNEFSDACTRSPAMVPTVLTVAATYVADENETATATTVRRDRRADFSNYGTCVNIAAPGKDIRSAWINDGGGKPDATYYTLSGTSMASPHVAGVTALVLSRFPEEQLTPREVGAYLRKHATNGVIDLACEEAAPDDEPACRATPNKLLFTNC